MFKYGFKQFEKHIISNIFLALQLALSLFLIICVTSSIFSRIQYYIPVRNILNKQGIYLFTHDGLKVENGVAVKKLNTQDIKNENKNIEKVYALYCSNIFWSEEFGYTISSITYDETTMSLYKPKLKEGIWLDEFNDESNNYIQVVVNENLGYKVGDTIIVYTTSYNRETQDTKAVEVPLKVAGVLNENEFVYGNPKTEYSNTDDFRTLFSNEVSICLRHSDLSKFNVSNSLGVQVFITLKDDCGEKEVLGLKQQYLESGIILKMSEMLTNSNRYIYNQIYIISPILICIILLLLVSSMSLAAIQTKRNIKSYALYYMCGSSWKKCLIINFVNSLLVTLLGIVITIIGLNLVKVFGLLKNTVITFGSWQMVFCITLILFNLLVSLIMPIRIMKKNTPKEIIATNE